MQRWRRNPPRGTRSIAAAEISEAATQLNKTVSIASSLPIDGRAILREETIKDAWKEDKIEQRAK
jgi:hypothetical protein